MHPRFVIRAVVNSLLAAGAGIALNLKKDDDKGLSEKPVTVKVGDREFTSGGSNADQI